MLLVVGLKKEPNEHVIEQPIVEVPHQRFHACWPPHFIDQIPIVLVAIHPFSKRSCQHTIPIGTTSTIQTE
jgi:hypothetical protein